MEGILLNKRGVSLNFFGKAGHSVVILQRITNTFEYEKEYEEIVMDGLDAGRDAADPG